MANLRLDRPKLRRRREVQGYSVPALARLLKVTPDHLYRIEYGTRRPSPELYARIARVLEIEPEELLLPDEAAGSAA